MSEKDNFKLEKEKAVKNLQVFTWENFEDKNVSLPMFAADAADDVYKNINYPKSVPIVSVIPKKKQMKTNATEGSQAKKVAEPVKKTTKKPDEATKPDEADDDDPRVLALLKELASAREARPPPEVRPIKKRSTAKSTKPVEATETKKVIKKQSKQPTKPTEATKATEAAEPANAAEPAKAAEPAEAIKAPKKKRKADACLEEESKRQRTLTHAGSQSLFCKGLATIIKSSSDLTEEDMLYLLYEFFSQKETKTAQAFVFLYKQLLCKLESKKASSDTDYFKTFFHSDAYSGVAGDDDAYVRALKGNGKDDISKFKQYIQMLGSLFFYEGISSA